MKFDTEDIKAVDGYELSDVMTLMGYRPAIITTTSQLVYHCPFHSDSNPSFCVQAGTSIHPESNKPYNIGAFCCKSKACGVSGFGALQLFSHLRGKTDSSQLPELMEELTSRLNIVLPSGAYCNDAWLNRTSKNVTPVSEMKFVHRTWSEQHLSALGCKTFPVYVPRFDGEEMIHEAKKDKEGNIILRTDWDQTTPEGKIVPLDTEQLSRLFSIYPVESYTTEARTENGEPRSYKYEFNEGYPVFEFRFKDAKGWWSKKYEPGFRPHMRMDGKPAVNYKFTWWYQGGRKHSRDAEMGSRLYGDSDVMDALSGVEPSTSCPLHPVVEHKFKNANGEEVTYTKFHRIIICSGPRDAMNVWYHSDAHVVYPHSESVEISDDNMEKLRRIADNICVLYDTDVTGMKAANQLCLRFLDVRLIQLPEKEMAQVKSPRSGKPCKDVSEYFENWDRIKKLYDNPELYKKVSCSLDFMRRVNSAKTLDFIKSERHIRPKTKEEFMKYSIDGDSMILFLTARGIMRAPKKYPTAFVLIKNNIVEGLPENEVVSTAKLMMKNFIMTREDWTVEMSNAISSSNRLTISQMMELPFASLDFNSCGESFDYLFFCDTAIYVEGDTRKPVPYRSLPFYVSKDRILKFPYIPFRGEFPVEFVENPATEAELIRHAAVMASSTASEQETENKRFNRWYSLNYIDVSFKCPIDKMPETLQFLMDVSNIKNYKERNGMPLSDYDVKFNKAHFASKSLFLGYFLHRFRTEANQRSLVHQRMVCAVDYFRQQQNLNCGRSGKSTMEILIGFARNPLHINGKSFRADVDIAKNFANFDIFKHDGIFVDDWNKKISMEELYNLTTRVETRSLYSNPVMLDPEDTPKFFITQNVPFNTEELSTRGRIMPMLFSDYYHEQNEKGSDHSVTPLGKFGHVILEYPIPSFMERIKKSDPERYKRIQYEASVAQEYLIRSLQLWIKFSKKDVVFPPMDDDTTERVIDTDPVFVEWADRFFAVPEHYGVLLPVQEMIYSFLVYKGNPDARNGKMRFIDNMITRIRDNSREFRNSLMMYCNLHHIINTPLHLIRGKTDRENGIIRSRHWITRFDDKGRESYPHRHVLSVTPSGSDRSIPCRIFFRPGDAVYADYKDIPRIPDDEPGENWMMIDCD